MRPPSRSRRRTRTLCAGGGSGRGGAAWSSVEPSSRRLRTRSCGCGFTNARWTAACRPGGMIRCGGRVGVRCGRWPTRRRGRCSPASTRCWAPTGRCMTCGIPRPTGWPAIRSCRSRAVGAWARPSVHDAAGRVMARALADHAMYCSRVVSAALAWAVSRGTSRTRAARPWAGTASPSCAATPVGRAPPRRASSGSLTGRFRR
jgi:hypothetical protein